MQKKDNQKINILILMAGKGQRFKDAGFKIDKPFIRIDEKMLVEYVLNSFDSRHNFYLAIRSEFLNLYPEELNYLKNKYNVEYIEIEKVTSGAASTALLSYDSIKKLELPLLVADSDNFYINNVANNFIDSALEQSKVGSLATFNSNNPGYSYVLIDENNNVISTKEKEVVSNQAICGLYYFQNSKSFFIHNLKMHAYGEKVKEEFYMSNIYNRLAKEGIISYFSIEEDSYISIGTPELLNKYLEGRNKDAK